MSRKDYKLIASVLNAVWQSQYSDVGTVKMLVDRLVDALETDNPSFDPERFCDAVYKTKRESQVK